MTGAALTDAQLGHGPGEPSADVLPALRRLELTAFRSYAHARLDLDPRPVVLTGPNGAGKTNLLEAISFLAPGRGLRRAALADVTRAGDSGQTWAVAARVDTRLGPITVGTGQDPGAPASGRRLVRINGAPASGQTALADVLTVGWLTPQMDRLFLGSAGDRRRFFDRIVYGFHGDHAGRLTTYEQAMRERNRLLKDRVTDDAWLSSLEHTMAENGVAVAAARVEVAARLRTATRQSPADSPFPRPLIALHGTVEASLGDGRPALDVEDDLRTALARRRGIDAAAGAATDGPHRADLLVRHAAKDLPADQCSTGEQKALLIGLVLANARLMAVDRGAPPLLLLDEVAAHLDEQRRAALFDAVSDLGAQAWMTGTDAVLFRDLGSRAQWLRVQDGAVQQGGP